MPRPHRSVSRRGLLVTTLFASAGMGVNALSAMAAPAQADPALTPLDELRKTFTVEGKPVPPEVFRDMGDGDLANSGSIIVTIDVKAATGSNLYADDIKASGNWITQTKQASKESGLTEESAYKFVGTTQNKLLVAIASFSGGGVRHLLHAAYTRCASRARIR